MTPITTEMELSRCAWGGRVTPSSWQRSVFLSDEERSAGWIHKVRSREIF